MISEAQIFADRWQHDESPFLNPDWSEAWREIAAEINGDDAPAFLCRPMMSAEELLVFDALPDTVTVYRGINLPAGEPVNRDSFAGLSWTLEHDRAAWFARRFLGVIKHDGRRYDRAYVATGMVHKSAIYALFVSREESEVVVEPEYVEIEHIEPI